MVNLKNKENLLSEISEDILEMFVKNLGYSLPTDLRLRGDKQTTYVLEMVGRRLRRRKNLITCRFKKEGIEIEFYKQHNSLYFYITKCDDREFIKMKKSFPEFFKRYFL